MCKSVSPAAGYQAGARGWLWTKLKRDYRTELSDTVDVVVVGAFAGRGRLERRLQAVAGGRVTDSSGGMPWYGSISMRASWPVQPWLRVEEGRSAVSTLGLP